MIPYDPSEIDFVVAYVMPCDAWFVIPVGGDLRAEDGEDVFARKSGEREAGEVLGSLGIDDDAVAGK